MSSKKDTKAKWTKTKINNNRANTKISYFIALDLDLHLHLKRKQHQVLPKWESCLYYF